MTVIVGVADKASSAEACVALVARVHAGAVVLARAVVTGGPVQLVAARVAAVAGRAVAGEAVDEIDAGAALEARVAGALVDGAFATRAAPAGRAGANET